MPSQAKGTYICILRKKNGLLIATCRPTAEGLLQNLQDISREYETKAEEWEDILLRLAAKEVVTTGAGKDMARKSAAAPLSPADLSDLNEFQCWSVWELLLLLYLWDKRNIFIGVWLTEGPWFLIAILEDNFERESFFILYLVRESCKW